MSGFRPWARIGAVLCALAGTALVLDHQWLDSPTMDEPFHALASAEYVISGTYFANLEHPPLTKLLAGLTMRSAGVRPPRFTKPFTMAGAEQPNPFSFQNSVTPEALFAAARKPFPLLFLALVLLAAELAARWGGSLAGFATAALLSFEPTLVGHAGVLHTDVAAALAFLGTLALALLALEKRSLWLWAATGAALGLSLATKFTEIYLVLLLAALALLYVLLVLRAGRHDWRPLGGLAIAFLLAVPALLGPYALAMRQMTKPEAEQAVRIFLASRGAQPPMVERVVAISRVSKEAGHYLAGLAGIALQNKVGGGVNVLRGQLSQTGFWEYFFVAFAVKSSLAFLALVALGLLALVVRRGAVADIPVVALLVSAACLFASVMGSSYNIGIRHLMPVYPLLGIAAVVLLCRALPVEIAASLLALGIGGELYETARVHPHELSFFNALAGGPRNGAAWLSDSNLDWGQDLYRACEELETRGLSREATVAYFGGGDPRRSCPDSRLFDGQSAEVKPGTYAVSQFLLAAGPELLALRGKPAPAAAYAALREAVRKRGKVVGRVGYSVLLVQIAPP